MGKNLHICEGKRSLALFAAALEEEMRRLKDQSNQRMEMLRRRSKDAFSATQWLLKNEGLFAGKIYPPVMTQVGLCPSFARVLKFANLRASKGF